MSLLLERGVPEQLLPQLEGREVLVDRANPEICKVKGVMFVARNRFMKEVFGDAAFHELVTGLSEKTRAYAERPLAASWYEFASLVEYDRAIHDEFHGRYPHVLALLGASSAEYGIGTLYRALDERELIAFLGRIANFHTQYQKYGRVSFTPTERGGRMAYHDYVCYSPVFCASAIGFFMEAILRHGGRDPRVLETRCHCRGDDACLYDLEWR